MGNCTSKKNEDVVAHAQSVHQPLPKLPAPKLPAPRMESFATVYSRSSSKQLDSKPSLRRMTSTVLNSGRLLVKNTTAISTSNLTIEQQSSSSRRLLHITAKPVIALPNYERPIFYKSKSERVSIDKVLEKLFIFNTASFI